MKNRTSRAYLGLVVAALLAPSAIMLFICYQPLISPAEAASKSTVIDIPISYGETLKLKAPARQARILRAKKSITITSSVYRTVVIPGKTSKNGDWEWTALIHDPHERVTIRKPGNYIVLYFGSNLTRPVGKDCLIL